MPASSIPVALPLGLPAHPHQLEVQEFDAYGLIVDLRPEADYAEDHLPWAISLPLTDPFAAPGALAPGTASGSRAPLTAQDAEIDIPPELRPHLDRLQHDDAVLVYCDRGGLDSGALALSLRRRGYPTDVLPGGWPNYRRWVTASIEALAWALNFRWLRCEPGGAAQAVLSVLEAQGQQVVSLASLLGQRRFPGLSLKGDAAPSQAFFESLLVNSLRRMDPQRSVWVDEALLLNQVLVLPPILAETLTKAEALRLQAPLVSRVSLLKTYLETQAPDFEALIVSLRPVVPTSLRPPLDVAYTLAAKGRADEALVTVLADCTDRLYQERAAASPPHRESRLDLASLSTDDVWAALSALPAPWPAYLEPDPDQISP